jgi:hypothetical protein
MLLPMAVMGYRQRNRHDHDTRLSPAHGACLNAGRSILIACGTSAAALSAWPAFANLFFL